MMQADLPWQEPERAPTALGPGAWLLPALARDAAPALLGTIGEVAGSAPFRHLITPGGRRMSVAMTNCGRLGWVSDLKGYRYDPIDPESGARWPEMPPPFRDIAGRAAANAGFAGFQPDACLINRYEPGSRLSLHQDRDEADFNQPIVSVSLGVAATFLWGGSTRTAPVRRLRLEHGDVVVWGGEDRLRFHGIAPLKDNMHPRTGLLRYNLTFRAAGA